MTYIDSILSFCLKIIKCPVRFLTGISCPGCGMTRAWVSVLRLDFSAAFHYHPLFWVVITAVILLLIKKRISRRLYNGIVLFLIILLMIVYLFRLFDPACEIVTFSPREGLIYKVLHLQEVRNVLSTLR